MPNLQNNLNQILETHKNIINNADRRTLISEVIERKEAVIASSGALLTWTKPDSTGRSPNDTYVVKDEGSVGTVDWTSKAVNPISSDIFDELFEDALQVLEKKERIYSIDRVIGADLNYALETKVISDKSLTMVLCDNMFREIPTDIEKSIFHKNGFTLLALPYDKVQSKKYEGKLRKIDGKTSDMFIAMDMGRRLGLVYGSAYLGTVKKMMFTVMNYYLPEKGILPLHCGANIGEKNDTALFLGLSGTGKTTLSADINRPLIGDDEHGWSDNGIANFENGCYAKLINLNPKKEPEIFDAVFTKRGYLENGCIIENTMMFPNGEFDLYDDRLTPNSRGSYPMSFLKNVKKDAQGGHPKKIIFLTADANGVLPPVSKLNKNQAMLWFLMGYTSKLAGTETGITKPKTVFSRFFGEPFMPRNPSDYASLLGEKMDKFKTEVYLVNTGWSGGPYGIGERMDIKLTKRIIQAILNDELENVEYKENKLFHLNIPVSCPDIDCELLNPENTWSDKEAYKERAQKLAQEFSEYFDSAYKNISDEIKAQCPGK